MSCPAPETLVAEVAGDLTANESKRLARHLASCADCRARLQRLTRLTAALPSVTKTSADPAFSARVQARLDDARPRRPFARWAGVALAAASAIGVVLLRPSAENGPVARGGAQVASLPSIAVDLHPAAGGETRRLTPHATLARGDGLSFHVFDLPEGKPFVQLFAVDAANEIHWFLPAFPDDRADPLSPRLDAPRRVIDLPEGVTPEDPAPGAFRIVGLFSDRPVRARDVEALVARGGLEALQSLPIPHHIDVLETQLQPSR